MIPSVGRRELRPRFFAARRAGEGWNARDNPLPDSPTGNLIFLIRRPDGSSKDDRRTDGRPDIWPGNWKQRTRALPADGENGSGGAERKTDRLGGGRTCEDGTCFERGDNGVFRGRPCGTPCYCYGMGSGSLIIRKTVWNGHCHVFGSLMCCLHTNHMCDITCVKKYVVSVV